MSFCQMYPVYAILDGPVLRARGVALAAAARSLLEGGIRLLQIRWKDNWTQAVYDEAIRIRDLSTDAGATLVVNDRADIAMLLNAGVHVGQDDLPPALVRNLMGTSAYIGYSTHNEQQFRAALTEPTDYVALGPIYGTASKINPDPVVGIDELKRLKTLSAKPVVAIGGITLERAPEAWSAGADSVAIIGDLYAPGCTPESIRHRASEWAKAAHENCNC
jgi:thiamine-phosphate pyrophosphorylase